jgi:acetylornithine deacetylase/succinyl-diaminopimelate desuccinylase-like protein
MRLRSSANSAFSVNEQSTASNMSDTLTLAKQLISRHSLTPMDDGCIDIIGTHLAALDFSLEKMRHNEVDNLWARRGDAGKQMG